LASGPGGFHPARFFVTRRFARRFAFAVAGFRSYGEGIAMLFFTDGVS